MAQIIAQDEGCYLCRSAYGLETHHCVHGTANRRKADEDGLTVRLCHRCHMDLHARGYGDRMLHQVAEHAWLRHYGKTKADWVARYGKNYL